MPDHAIAALRKRREEIGGQVHDAEKRVTKMIVGRLNVLVGRGEIAKTGKTRDAR